MADGRTHANQPEGSPGTREDKSQAFEDLRNILLAPEQEEIADLRQRVENQTVRAEDVSTVVAEAIELRREHGGTEDLNHALTPTVEEALRESVRKDPSVLAGALFPVMGPAIRKSIAESIRSMLESFNEALDHSLSYQGVRWRVESFRTGKPFAEIVLVHSLVYRVEQVFLIHKATSLMLAHCVAPRVATQDPSLVSGMLSAIQSYVRDSFKAPKEDSLDSIQVGELEVWVEAGPQAILAAVIRGHAPASYRATLEKTIEEIHRDFGRALEEFDGDSAPFAAAEPRLELCLESHYQPRKSAKRRPYVLVLAVLALIVAGFWTFVAVRDHLRLNRLVNVLQNEDGIVVTSFRKQGGRLLVRGLRDPLAPDDGALLKKADIEPGTAKLELTPFFALDDESVKRRAIDMLKPPKEVRLTVSEGVLGADGTAPSDWARSLKDRAAFVPGLKSVDASQLEVADRSEIVRVEAALNSTILTFPIGIARFESGQETTLTNAAEQIKSLLTMTAALRQTPTIEVIGHTDTSGTESANLPLSRLRAEFVMSRLVEAGVESRYLIPKGVATSQPVTNGGAIGDSRLQRSVTLRVVPAKSSQNQ